MIVLGIDPGLTGAVALVSKDVGEAPTLLYVVDMPTVKAKQGKSVKSHLNLPALAALMSNPAFPRPDAVVVEEVGAMPGQGVTSMFRFGYSAGAPAGIAAALQLPTHTIRPQEWKPIAGARGDKDAGRLRASQLFPGHAHLFARAKDNGRADAVLIAFSGAVKISR